MCGLLSADYSPLLFPRNVHWIDKQGGLTPETQRMDDKKEKNCFLITLYQTLAAPNQRFTKNSDIVGHL